MIYTDCLSWGLQLSKINLFYGEYVDTTEIRPEGRTTAGTECLKGIVFSHTPFIRVARGEMSK